MTCPVCDDTMSERLSNRAPRTYCSKRCACIAIGGQHRARALDRVEDVEELLAAGESAEQVASRLGSTVGGLARSMHRAGRGDLGRIFDRAARAARRAAKAAA